MFQISFSGTVSTTAWPERLVLFFDFPSLGFVLAPDSSRVLQLLAQSTEIFQVMPFMFPAETVIGPCHRFDSYQPLLSHHAQKRAKCQERGMAGSLHGGNLICLEL